LVNFDRFNEPPGYWSRLFAVLSDRHVSGRRYRGLLLVAALALLVVTPSLARAQLRGVKAALTPLVESDAPAGGRVRAALQIRVPDGFHLQSNAPRDPSLIATTLVFTVPDRVRALEVVFPKTVEFTLAGQTEALAVFEHEFAIGVQFEVAAATAPGPIDVPA
jgi:hypothetical protein